jgi:nicotinamide-nucleotide amidase
VTDAASLVAAALARGWRIATAESLTGGLIAAAISEVPGASAVLDCGFVAYSPEAKTAMLGVAPATIAHMGLVSEAVAAEMARGALTRSRADLAVAVTGLAGPGGAGALPEGRVCFGLAGPGGLTLETVDFGAIGRAAVRRATVAHALRLLHAQAAGPQPPAP